MPNPNDPDDAGLNLPPLVRRDPTRTGNAEQAMADEQAEKRAAAEAREWARIAHDAMHELEAELVKPWPDDEDAQSAKNDKLESLLDRAHEAVHAAVQDDPPPAETAASDLRPFDRAFTSLAREHGVAAVWIAAHPDGHLHSGGHVELNTALIAVIHAGMKALGEATPAPSSSLIVPAPSRNGSGLVVPGP